MDNKWNKDLEKIIALPQIKKAVEKRKVGYDELNRQFFYLKKYYDEFIEFPDKEVYCNLNPDADYIVINEDLNKEFIQIKNCKQEFKIKQEENNKINYVWDDFNKAIYKESDVKSLHSKGNKRIIADELVKKIISFNTTNNSASGLYIYGKVGVGKTFTTAILAKELSKKYEVAHIFLPDFVRRFKSNIPGEVNPLQKNFENIAESKFLIIDDIGAEHISQWSMNEILLNILQRRNNKNKFTIFTSNYKLDQLKQRYLKATNDYVGTDRVIERIKRITKEREMI